MCFFFKQETSYDMRISDGSSDVCSSDLESLQSLRDALENGEEVEAGGAIHLCSKEPAAKVCFGGESYFAGNRGSSARTARRALLPELSDSRRRRYCPPVCLLGWGLKYAYFASLSTVRRRWGRGTLHDLRRHYLAIRLVVIPDHPPP